MRSSIKRSLFSKRLHTVALLILITILLILLEFQHRACPDGSSESGSGGEELSPVGRGLLNRHASSSGRQDVAGGDGAVGAEYSGKQKIEKGGDQAAEEFNAMVDENDEIVDTLKIPLSNDPIFENVSRIGDQNTLFMVVPDEHYLSHNKSVFTTNPSIQNDFSYKLSIDGPRICVPGEKVFVLVLIPSVSTDKEMRDAIRRTWLSAGEAELWPRATVGVKVKHIFFLAKHAEIDEQLIHEESKLHKDIVLADFDDSYRNLSIKILVGLQWVQTYCPQAKIVLKVDQDTLINLPMMTAFLRHVRWRAGGDAADFVMGLRHYTARPLVRRGGRWGVREEEYPLPYFPGYLYGHAYAISAPRGLARILEAAHHVPLIAPEDAFITGILAKTANVLRITSRVFTVCCRNFISKCEAVLNERAAFTGLDKPEMIDSLWADIILHRCDKDVDYRAK